MANNYYSNPSSAWWNQPNPVLANWFARGNFNPHRSYLPELLHNFYNGEQPLETPATTQQPQPQNPSSQKIEPLLEGLNESQDKELREVINHSNDINRGMMYSNIWKQEALENGGRPKTRPVIQSAGIAPSNQDILNQYNAWLRAGNPGNTFEWRLADGTTITEQNVNNILNPYGFGKPEGVPSYIPEEVQQRNIISAMNPNWTEAQIQRQQNFINPNNRIPRNWW